MNKTLIAIIASCLIIGFVAASVLVTYIYPNKVTVVTAQLTQYLDRMPWSNGTMIDWGECEPDSTYQFDNLTVYNNGSKAVTVYLSTVGLPSGWTYTWAASGTLLNIDEKTEAPLILYVGSDAVDGEYTFTTHVNAEEA